MFANHSHIRYEFNNTEKLVKKLARIEASSICHQQFANMFADCICAVHTHQLEFANFSLPCEGRFRFPRPSIGGGGGGGGVRRGGGGGFFFLFIKKKNLTFFFKRTR